MNKDYFIIHVVGILLAVLGAMFGGEKLFLALAFYTIMVCAGIITWAVYHIFKAIFWG